MAGEDLEALQQQLAENARETLRLLVSRVDDPERLALLDARAAVLRARVSAARPKSEDAPLSLLRGLRPEAG
ncbi:MAG: hypothetical protein ACJ8GN_04085 [Longimicrobiaceae bacterium]